MKQLVFENLIIQLQPVRKTSEPIATWSPSVIILQWPVLFYPPCYFLLLLIHLNIAALVHQHLARYLGAISNSVLDVAIDRLARHYLVDAYDGWYDAVCRGSSFPAHLDPPKEWANAPATTTLHTRLSNFQGLVLVMLPQTSWTWLAQYLLRTNDSTNVLAPTSGIQKHLHSKARAAMKSTGSCGGWTRLQALPVCYLAGRHVEPQLKTLQRRRLAALQAASTKAARSNGCIELMARGTMETATAELCIIHLRFKLLAHQIIKQEPSVGVEALTAKNSIRSSSRNPLRGVEVRTAKITVWQKPPCPVARKKVNTI